MQEEVQNQRILSNGSEGKQGLSDLIEEKLKNKGFTQHEIELVAAMLALQLGTKERDRDIQLLVALSAWQSAAKEEERLPNWAKTWIKEIGFEEPKYEKFKKMEYNAQMRSNAQVAFMDRCRARLQIKNERLVRFISEFFATALLLFIGLGIVFQFILTHEKLNAWININIGWGFALMFCIYATSQTSGGHMNPAVSFLMYTLGNLSLADFFIYSIIQVAGAFFGTSLAYLVYFDQVQHFTNGLNATITEDNVNATITGYNATIGLFCSMPAAHLSNTGAFVDQVAGTALLSLCLVIIIDKRNKIPDFLHPMFLGFMLIMIGTAYGMNLGYPINPARDLGPRLFAYLIGYSSDMFSYHNYYFWIPVVAPFFGALLGSWTYQLAVGFHIKDKKEIHSPKIQLQNGKDEELERLAAYN